jgi:hypothetical protein
MLTERVGSALHEFGATRVREVPGDEPAAVVVASARVGLAGRHGAPEGAVGHLGDPDLEAAVSCAVRRTVGDSWAWSRRSSATDISPLVAGSIALWALESTHRERQYVVSWRSALGDDRDEDPELESDPLDPERLAAVMRSRGFDDATITRVLEDDEEGA